MKHTRAALESLQALTAELSASGKDPEEKTRPLAAAATLEYLTRSTRSIDTGKEPIENSPLFGGPRQRSMFDQ